MSVQSERGRVDFNQSDHAKGTRVAGDVELFDKAFSDAAAAARAKNQAAESDAVSGLIPPDTTNVTLFRKKKMKGE